MKTLCAIDGSTGSDSAVGLLGKLLPGENDEIIFYYSPPAVRISTLGKSDDEMVREAAEALAAKVFHRAHSLVGERFSGRLSTVIGKQKPRLGIPAAAKKFRPDLIAVGARGTSVMGLPRLGSVSRAVVHSSDVPVLVARPRLSTEAGPMQVLLCCDDIQRMDATLACVRQLSLAEEWAGHVMHVTESLFGQGIPEWLAREVSTAEADPMAKAYVEELEQQVEQWEHTLSTLCEALPPAFRSSQPVVLSGHPGEQILHYVEAQQIDLVVVGARVLGPITRIFAGSTSEHVLIHVPCSVLIVPHHPDP